MGSGPEPEVVRPSACPHARDPLGLVVLKVETLSEVHSVFELVLPDDREPILSTTGTRAALELLAARVVALEDAVRELTLVVQGLTRPQRSGGI